MAWYEHQPFYWILKNLTAREITNLILGVIIITLLIGSYYVYIDTIQCLKNNPLYVWLFKNVVILIIIILIFLILLTFELNWYTGLIDLLK
jgi:hypothetical protein